MTQGLYRYEPKSHALRLVVTSDVRRVTGHQDFVDSAPLDLIFVADQPRMTLVPLAQRVTYAHTTATIAMQIPASGLATVCPAA